MKKILTFILSVLMLFSCVSCSGGNELSGAKRPLPSTLPMEKRPATVGSEQFADAERKAFSNSDPRKKYLEDKYGVTAYLVAENTGALCDYFALKGYDGVFQLYAKEDLLAEGVSEEYLVADYIDNAYFTVAYAEIYEYFEEAVEKSGVKIDRMIIGCNRVRYFATGLYDLDKSFEECLESMDNAAFKRFEIIVYGDFKNADNAAGKLLVEFDKLDFIGSVVFYNVVQDIDKLTNDDLSDYSIYKDYIEFYDRRDIK